jgi:hypothetical protein
MLKQEVFQKVSEVFGTVVGVASMVTVMDMDDVSQDMVGGAEEYKRFSDEIDINLIIRNAIEVGKYQQLQRNVCELNRNRHHRIKDLTIYKRAWDKIKGR